MPLEFLISTTISFLLGGGLATLVKARADSRLTNAQAATLGAKTAPEVTDLSVSTLARVNEQLTADYARVRQERDEYAAELEEMRGEVAKLHGMLERAQADLTTANKAISALTSRLSALPHYDND